MRVILFLFSLLLVCLSIGGAVANDLSPTFLPMITGEWRISSDHSLNGLKSHQSCLTNEELQKVYSNDELWQVFKENRAECQLIKNNTRNTADYRLTCKEPGMVMIIQHKLTKNSYREYVLEKSLIIDPEMPSIGFKEVVLFERIGKCQSSPKN